MYKRRQKDVQVKMWINWGGRGEGNMSHVSFYGLYMAIGVAIGGMKI